jgi:hypothetical protein
MTGKVRAQAKNAYGRDLRLAQRVQYVHIVLLAKIWHTVQIFPAPVVYTQELKTEISWYIRQGAFFRVPMSMLQRPKKQGGWALLDISVKCRALLLKRVWAQSTTNGTATATWLKAWDLAGTQANPPNVGKILNGWHTYTNTRSTWPMFNHQGRTKRPRTSCDDCTTPFCN